MNYKVSTKIKRTFVVVVQWLSCVWLFVTPWTTACQSLLSFTVSQSLLKFISFELVMIFNNLMLCYPLLLFVFNLSQHLALFQWVGSSHQVTKILELQLHHQSLPIQCWFPLGLTSLISLQFKGLSTVISSTRVWSVNSFVLSFLYKRIYCMFIYVYNLTVITALNALLCRCKQFKLSELLVSLFLKVMWDTKCSFI